MYGYVSTETAHGACFEVSALLFPCPQTNPSNLITITTRNIIPKLLLHKIHLLLTRLKSVHIDRVIPGF
jgi:hypothetical protein